MRRIHTIPESNQSFTFFLPKGQWGNIYILYDGTADTGNTVVRSDCGNIRFVWNGDDVINVDAEFINLANNVYGGTARFSAVEADATTMLAVIPSGLWYDPVNIFDIGDKDEVYLKCDFSQLATELASGSVKVYVKPQLGVMNYLHKITSRFVVASGESILADTFPTSNISQVYLKNPAASNVTDIQIVKNNETVVDSPTADLIYYSDYIHQLETTSTLLAIDMDESKSSEATLGKQVSYKYTFSDSGTLSQYFSYVQFTNEKAVQSRANTRRKILAAAGQNM